MLPGMYLFLGEMQMGPAIKDFTCLRNDVLHNVLYKIVVRGDLLGQETVVLEESPDDLPTVLLVDLLRVLILI